MSNIPRFAAYAAAFEKAYESDDWSSLRDFFTEDAVYEVGLPLLGAERCEGRQAILEWFPKVVEGFDRRFESRTLRAIDGPREDGDAVWIHGLATYRAPGIPDFELELEETAHFREGRIHRLVDAYAPEMKAEARRFLAEVGPRLGLRLALGD